MDENKPAARAPVATVAATFALAAAFLSTGTAFPQDDPSGKLSVWTGRWAYHVQNYNTPFGRSSTYDGTADCSWSANAGFVVCDFLNHNPPPGFPCNDLGILSYDARTKTYSRVALFKESKPFSQKVAVAGNIWIMSARIPFKGKTVILRDVYVFRSSASRTTTTSVSADNGKTWITVTKFTAVRIGASR